MGPAVVDGDDVTSSADARMSKHNVSGSQTSAARPILGATMIVYGHDRLSLLVD